VSVEGRKFLKFIPFDISYPEFRKSFILGKNVFGTLRSEDIDDFFDALAGGMRASIMVHFRNCRSSGERVAWETAIVSVARAVKEAMSVNHLRRGLPPGVKATLI
jgi:imidazoleglycerol phosphate dehydratase HisB